MAISALLTITSVLCAAVLQCKSLQQPLAEESLISKKTSVGFHPQNTSNNNPIINNGCDFLPELEKNIHCYNNSEDWLNISEGYCLTYDVKENSIFGGRCPYNFFRESDRLIISSNLSGMQENMCGRYKRRGRLCGLCMDGYGPSMSSTLQCIKCPLGWFKYFVIQTFPSIILLLVIMIFNIQFSKSPWNAWILYCQIMFYGIGYDSKLRRETANVSNVTFYEVSCEILMPLFGLFSLDHGIFRIDLFSTILCINSSSLKGIHLMMIKYVEAAIPLFLIIVVYVSVSLYNRNFKPFVFVWNLIRRMVTSSLCSQRCLRRADPYISIANTFAAFLNLIYTKILFISLNLLIPNKVYEVRGDQVIEKWTLYYDPTVEYFQREHIPCAITAMLILSVFVILPIILFVLYPFKPFVLFLKFILRSKWHSLNYFMDIFQGWFKNGVEGTSLDYRFVSAIFPLLKVAALVVFFAFTDSSHACFLISIVFQVTGLFFAIFRPYKKTVMNQLDAVLIWLLGLLPFMLNRKGNIYIMTAEVVAWLPPLLMAVCIGFKVLRWIKTSTDIVELFQSKFQHCCHKNHDDDNLPPLISHGADNMLCSRDYDAIIH